MHIPTNWNCIHQKVVDYGTCTIDYNILVKSIFSDVLKYFQGVGVSGFRNVDVPEEELFCFLSTSKATGAFTVPVGAKRGGIDTLSSNGGGFDSDVSPCIGGPRLLAKHK